MKNTLISTAIIAIAMSSSAAANTITWPLVGTTNQLLGTTDTVTSSTGNISMVISGFLTSTNDEGTGNTWLATTAKATALYSKHGSGDEIGLGINADPSGDHEIIANSFIQVNLTNLLAQKSITSLQITMGSVTAREDFTIWGSNTAGQPGTLLMTGTPLLDDVTFNLPDYGAFKYVSFSAMGGNVLLDTITTTTTTTQSPTPEPGTLSSLGLGVCLVLVSRKRIFKGKA